MSMILLVLQAMTVIVGPILLGWWLRRRFDVPWQIWGWGALAFVGSQVVRIPLLVALTVLLPPDSLPFSEGQLFWLNLLILTLSAGFFEETARYIVLRWRKAEAWEEGIMFGAGHGGIEAILLVGGATITNLVLLSLGETVLAQVEASNPEQVEPLVTQIEAIRHLTWWQPLLAIWERVLAITFHIVASLLVLRAVREEDRRWWFLAILLHIIFNATVLIAFRYGGAVVSEVALTVLVVLGVWMVKDRLA